MANGRAAGAARHNDLISRHKSPPLAAGRSRAVSFEEKDFNKDDLKAGQVAHLAAFFMGLVSPVSTARVNEVFYADLKPEAQKKQFYRDRESLEEAGLYIKKTSDNLWQVDEGRSYASGAELTPSEAIALDLACQPLLEDEGFAPASELRFALAKIDRTFGDAERAVETRTETKSRVVKTLEACLANSHVARISYRGATGATTERDFAPMGIFSLRGHGYMVGEDPAKPEGDRMRTLRLDRVLRARETKQGFAVPDGFDVDEYRRLPFQIGSCSAEVSFFVPTDGLPAETLGKGIVREDDGTGRLVWSVPASSIEDAACWAVAQGLAPAAPAELVDAWRGCLEGAMRSA